VQLIAPNVARVILVARNETRLRKFHEQVAAELPCAVSYTTDVSKRCAARSLILTATSRRKTSSSPKICKSGAVVCELSLPHDVSRRVALERPDVLVIEGGNMRVPGDPRFERVREPERISI
jgi:fatty aldehyde-generating acyl-ACP reductase